MLWLGSEPVGEAASEMFAIQHSEYTFLWFTTTAYFVNNNTAKMFFYDKRGLRLFDVSILSKLPGVSAAVATFLLQLPLGFIIFAI